MSMFKDITEREVVYCGNTPRSTFPPKEPYPLPKDPFQKQANIIFQQVVNKQGAIFIREEQSAADLIVMLRIPCIPPEGGNIIARVYEGHGIDLTTSLIDAHSKMTVNFPECKITDPGWIL